MEKLALFMTEVVSCVWSPTNLKFQDEDVDNLVHSRLGLVFHLPEILDINPSLILQENYVLPYLLS
jgi:hypothetical protein